MQRLNHISVVLRSLLVYALVMVPAIWLGITVTNPLDYEFMGFLTLLLAVLGFPFLIKWHYPWLLFSWLAPLNLFFLPGSPPLFLIMALISLGISVLDHWIMSRSRFLSAPQVTWPLMVLAGVVLITAELTGGMGVRALGASVYGGKKYAMLLIGILSFFALIAQPIPKAKAKLYVTLFLLGSGFSFIQDLYPLTPAPLQFIYGILGVNSYETDSLENLNFEPGITRLAGFGVTGLGLANLLLARYGAGGLFKPSKLWRPVVFILALLLVFLGGFRSMIIGVVFVFGLIFWLEGLHRTTLMLPVVLVGIFGITLLVPLAAHLPHTFQRSLAFLPLEISQDARQDAQGSSEWRFQMWEALLPQIPNYLLLGKGLAISPTTFNEVMSSSHTGFKVVNAAQDPLALANDFHSGPLSVIIPFGLWGCIAWLWFWGGGFYVLYRNHKHGDPDLKLYNRYLLATHFVNGFMFLFVFGDMSRIAIFCGPIGLSVALNHGVRGPVRGTAPDCKPFLGLPLTSRPRPVV